MTEENDYIGFSEKEKMFERARGAGNLKDASRLADDFYRGAFEDYFSVLGSWRKLMEKGSGYSLAFDKYGEEELDSYRSEMDYWMQKSFAIARERNMGGGDELIRGFVDGEVKTLNPSQRTELAMIFSHAKRSGGYAYASEIADVLYTDAFNRHKIVVNGLREKGIAIDDSLADLVGKVDEVSEFFEIRKQMDIWSDYSFELAGVKGI